MPEKPHSALAEVFVFLADSLRPDFETVDTMTTLLEAATTFTRASGGGILLADETSTLHVVASTSEQSAEVEEAQLGAAEGPCIDSFHSGRQVESARLGDELDRWPTFATAALDRGYHAVHAFPLSVRDQSIGAMNLFLEEQILLDDVEVAIVQALTGIVTTSILNRGVHEQHVETASQLRRALDSRVVIEQAKGVLMGRLTIPPEQAFELLRKQARSSGATLGSVAEAVTAQHAGV